MANSRCVNPDLFFGQLWLDCWTEGRLGKLNFWPVCLLFLAVCLESQNFSRRGDFGPPGSGRVFPVAWKEIFPAVGEGGRGTEKLADNHKTIIGEVGEMGKGGL